MIKEMLATGMSMGFMSSLVNIGSLTLQTAINKLGQEIIVAHTAARKITEIYMIMFSVFGQTMATFCGQNMGAGKVDRIKEGMKLAIIYTCVWSTFADDRKLYDRTAVSPYGYRKSQRCSHCKCNKLPEV